LSFTAGGSGHPLYYARASQIEKLPEKEERDEPCDMNALKAAPLPSNTHKHTHTHRERERERERELDSSHWHLAPHSAPPPAVLPPSSRRPPADHRLIFSEREKEALKSRTTFPLPFILFFCRFANEILLAIERPSLSSYLNTEKCACTRSHKGVSARSPWGINWSRALRKHSPLE
jgi:hypothetical protein